MNMSLKTFKRYEKKYLLNKEQFVALYSKLQQYMKPDKHCKDGNNYTIYNIYFDTDNNDIIRHSVSKPYYKEKLRLRSYKGNIMPHDIVFLELKKKIGGVVNKRRATMTLAEANLFIEEGIIPTNTDYINNQVLQEIAYFLKNNAVKPKAYICYDRIALFGKEDKNFRITFDYNIKTRREFLRLEQESFGTPLLDEGTYLMEVKINGAIPVWLARELSELNIYSTGFSKYGTEFKQYLLDRCEQDADDNIVTKAC